MKTGLSLLLGILCFIPVIFAAIFGTKSRMRFSKFLKKMSTNEREQFLKKNTKFNLIAISGFSIGVFAIVAVLVFKKEFLAQYFFLGLFGYILAMSIIGQLFIYRVSKRK
ncbi:MAG: hypothetical protein HN392_13525 [Anaerolineae bacterium]|mgnify:CR=1 FL=1|jgi:hypothetical protein|nr:hypothetical protein [Anaerolineae bacterium]MBT7075741.1 hypothetical protein [Anaerolineae bacterium]